MSPHGGLPRSLGESARTGPSRARFHHRRARPVASPAEDSPSGLWRSLGKRVGLTALRGSNPLSSATLTSGNARVVLRTVASGVCSHQKHRRGRMSRVVQSAIAQPRPPKQRFRSWSSEFRFNGVPYVGEPQSPLPHLRSVGPARPPAAPGVLSQHRRPLLGEWAWYVGRVWKRSPAASRRRSRRPSPSSSRCFGDRGRK